MSGWIAFSFLNDPLLAKVHFNRFYNNVGYPISLSRGAYWLGRTYEKIGNKEESFKWYKESTKYLTTYYGQLSHLKIYPNVDFELDHQMDVDKTSMSCSSSQVFLYIFVFFVYIYGNKNVFISDLYLVRLGSK